MSHMNKRNKYDKKDSLELGEKAEICFKNIAIGKGWDVSKASAKNNIDEHWDFLIQNHNVKYRVDVKAMKRISRSDQVIQDKWCWVELHGVRKNDRGWLYDGKSDLIAFEKTSSFIITQRIALIKLVEHLVDFTSNVALSKEAKYKIYSRPGRVDKITLIEIDKLYSIKWDEWEKI